MYQTVGHHAIDAYAEAMDLPLFRRVIEGASEERGRDYHINDKDEVEDLYKLLTEVKVRIIVTKGFIQAVFYGIQSNFLITDHLYI